MPRCRRAIAAVSLSASLTSLAADQASASQVGGQAPAFTLPATTGEKISLTDYTSKQNVVLFFYIAAFGCA